MPNDDFIEQIKDKPRTSWAQGYQTNGRCLPYDSGLAGRRRR